MEIFTAPTPIPEIVPIMEESVITEPSGSGNFAITPEDQADIYAAVLHEVHVENTDAETLYVLTTTDDSVGDPDIPRMPAATLDEDLQSGIQDALSGDPVTIRWIADRSEVPGLANGDGVVADGLLITLGNIQAQPDGSVWVSVSEYAGMLDGSGRTYILIKMEDGWEVIGTTGVEWTS